MEENNYVLGNDGVASKINVNSIDGFLQNMILYAVNAPVCAIYLVTKPVFMIGYAADCDAVLQFSKEISRHHACISWKDGMYEIEDLGSTNHTYVNGKALFSNQPRVLKDGDRVSFASFVFEVRVIKY